MTRTEAEILEEALDSLEVVSTYARRDTSDQLTIDAICMRIIAGVESLAKLEAARRDELFGDTWTHMRAMRNRIAHGYQFVDPRIVIRTAQTDVPRALAIIEQALAQ